MQFHHAGIATDDADRLASLYETLFDTPPVHEERFDGMKIVFLDIAGNGYFELVEPVDDGPIEQYIAERGPGLHHLALETDNIDEALEACRRNDIGLVHEEPRAGPWGYDFAFLHADSTGGVMIEFVEH